MWTVSVKAGQSELNEARVTNEQTKERAHHVTFLNLYIDKFYTVGSLLRLPASGSRLRILHHLEIEQNIPSKCAKTSNMRYDETCVMTSHAHHSERGYVIKALF